ncbi:hypothetical protein RRG08_037588 [Elysia crispata]|uniref:Band 7 domain-containing protein n=1 Tax=Elysia crispata TaxID=231223 RepID=A0AAE1DXW1_9GAST|nr:hypothetical protein RRG08_037588 [Elysia crispata]
MFIFRRIKKYPVPNPTLTSTLLHLCQVLIRDSMTVSVDTILFPSSNVLSSEGLRNTLYLTLPLPQVFIFKRVLTRDSVTVSVDAVVYYRISSPTISVANVENAANSTQLLAQTSLRNVLGTQNLSEILSNREHISEQMQVRWGERLERL